MKQSTQRDERQSFQLDPKEHFKERVMIRGLFTAASGMIAEQLMVDTIANNLANVNTTGFKRMRVYFQDLLYQTLRQAGTEVSAGFQIPSGIQVGHGTRPVATRQIFTVGNFQNTENPLDLAIDADGFFQILLPDGTTAYTRDGAFQRDSEGTIVNGDGFPLQPQIQIPDDAISLTVGKDGQVFVQLSGQSEPQNLGQIQLSRFINPAGLSKVGDNLFVETAASGAPVTGVPGEEGRGQIVQGFLEFSNVQVVEELVNLIIAQRAYEVNAKTIQTTDEMLQQANNLRR
jgi:flagellar basal-body rod protein FlgG